MVNKESLRNIFSMASREHIAKLLHQGCKIPEQFQFLLLRRKLSLFASLDYCKKQGKKAFCG